MDSLLNPDAPEFYPNFQEEVTLNGFTHIQNSIQASNLFPSGVSHDNFKTITDFNVISSQLCKNILEQSNKILDTNNQAVRFQINDEEHNTEKIIEANDNILDRTNTKIDIACGLRKSSSAITITEPMNPVNHVSSWNSPPILSKVGMASAELIAAKNIPRPQFNFKDPIDNSSSIWVPKIQDKPNSVKPLVLKMQFNDVGEPDGYEHPYEMELDQYHPPTVLLEVEVAPPKFPLPLEATPLTYIETETELNKLLIHLAEVEEIAVDVEHHAYRTYQGITCLIQLTTSKGDFIIDALALREHLHKLNHAFTDPKKLKVTLEQDNKARGRLVPRTKRMLDHAVPSLLVVFHGADMDVLWLQRDFGVYVVGLFDTYQAAKLLKLNGLSLKHLLMRYCQVHTDKIFQLADWRLRPLPAELLQYARVDTHYLLYIWKRMRAELQAGHSGGYLIYAAFEQSKHVCAKTYKKPVMHEEGHMWLLSRTRKRFDSRQMSALKLLYKWRDSQARELDESVAYVLPNSMLLSLAEHLPREVQGVTACCFPMPPILKQNLIAVHRIILSCRELPLEPQLYQMPLSLRAMVDHQREARRSVHDLAQLPDYRDDLQIAIEDRNNGQGRGFRFAADVRVFLPDVRRPQIISSKLNADAECFIPPYERYQKYRTLAQIEEIKEFRQQEAKIAVLGKGDELIQNEVLLKMKEPGSVSEPYGATANTAPAPRSLHPKQRKRKMSDKADSKQPETDKANAEPQDSNNLSNCDNVETVTPYDYKTANYKKFSNDTKNVNQKKFQHKLNHKKYKK